jgi:hypothetical protein
MLAELENNILEIEKEISNLKLQEDILKTKKLKVKRELLKTKQKLSTLYCIKLSINNDNIYIGAWSKREYIPEDLKLGTTYTHNPFFDLNCKSKGLLKPNITYNVEIIFKPINTFSKNALNRIDITYKDEDDFSYWHLLQINDVLNINISLLEIYINNLFLIFYISKYVYNKNPAI